MRVTTGSNFVYFTTNGQNNLLFFNPCRHYTNFYYIGSIDLILYVLSVSCFEKKGIFSLFFLIFIYHNGSIEVNPCLSLRGSCWVLVHENGPEWLQTPELVLLWILDFPEQTETPQSAPPRHPAAPFF